MADGFSLESYPLVKKWLKEASKKPMFRVICINILSEIFFDNISQKDLKVIFFRLNNYIKERRKGNYQFEKQLEGFNENGFTGKGKKIEVKKGEILYRVMNLEEIRAFCVGQGYDWDLGIDIDCPESIEILESLIKRHNEMGFVLVNFSGKNDIFWFTKAESLCSIIQKNKGCHIASLVRNALGLDSEDSKIMAEIQFESTYIENGKKPTIFDANFNIFFKPKSGKSEWGFTLDSETLTESLPEAIHKKMAFWPKISSYKILGNPNQYKFPSEEKWRQLRENCLYVLCEEGGIDKDTICMYIVTDEGDWR